MSFTYIARLACLLAGLDVCIAASQAFAQSTQSLRKFDQLDKFRQLEEVLPTPTAVRAASGAPGAEYWQQSVDYEIDVRIDDEKQHLHGSGKITYRNNSPDILTYLWLQLDANILRPDSHGSLSRTTADVNDMELRSFKSLLESQKFDGSHRITRCVDASTQKELHHTIVDTMMRIDLPEPLPPGESFEFWIDWNYAINNARVIRGRTGYEFFEEDGNYLYELAQWFPRLCAYTDYTGWQHKPFLGSGEFTLEFGNYIVRITVPDDHVVASTGTLLNPEQVLTADQRQRLQQAKSADKPVFIVTPDEARQNESSKPAGVKTWIFKADRVRDFAFATSRKFIWDAMQHNQGETPIMAMSFYPREGEPLWSRYSTHAIVHTLKVYSRYTFDYPYPVAISVNGPIGGMEYPMISFNGPRPEKDGTYTKRTKYGLISVIIHEVGHNYFPMIVNSDERQWTWMDEGLNTFLQYLSEQEWESDYPSWRGEPHRIVGYMTSPDQVPIMTSSDSLLQFGANAYAKPATALNILRETVLGRELFDFAFKEYAQRWKFKRPQPADFFRTMEDASGVDLDWFWRGWFYTTDHVDIAIGRVRLLNVGTKNPQVEKAIQRDERDAEPTTLAQERNEPLPKYIDSRPDLKDFYNDFDELDVTPQDEKAYRKFLEQLDDDERTLLDAKQNFYLVDFQNLGGLVMPVILQIEFEDGSQELKRFPAEIWARDNQRITRLIVTDKKIKSLTLDPRLETADADTSNNYFPPRIEKSRFKLFKERKESNPMQKAQGQEPEPDDDAEGGDQ